MAAHGPGVDDDLAMELADTIADAVLEHFGAATGCEPEMDADMPTFREALARAATKLEERIAAGFPAG